jgi:hypothetical protein
LIGNPDKTPFDRRAVDSAEVGPPVLAAGGLSFAIGRREAVELSPILAGIPRRKAKSCRELTPPKTSVLQVQDTMG